MVEFSADKGFVSSSFQQSLVSRYKETLLLVKKEMLRKDFMTRSQLILKKARFMHWDTYEQLLKLYIDCFNREESTGT